MNCRRASTKRQTNWLTVCHKVPSAVWKRFSHSSYCLDKQLLKTFLLMFFFFKNSPTITHICSWRLIMLSLKQFSGKVFITFFLLQAQSTCQLLSTDFQSKPFFFFFCGEVQRVTTPPRSVMCVTAVTAKSHFPLIHFLLESWHCFIIDIFTSQRDAVLLVPLLCTHYCCDSICYVRTCHLVWCLRNLPNLR